VTDTVVPTPRTGIYSSVQAIPGSPGLRGHHDPQLLPLVPLKAGLALVRCYPCCGLRILIPTPDVFAEFSLGLIFRLPTRQMHGSYLFGNWASLAFEYLTIMGSSVSKEG